MSRTRAALLSVTALEDRTTPALFAVILLSPEAGEPGDTMAAHAGRLRLNPAAPTDGAAAVVEAATPADAVRAALSGAVAVRVSGRSALYPFAPATAGGSAADRLPYLVHVNGDRGVVRLEDLARLRGLGVDWVCLNSPSMRTPPICSPSTRVG